MDFYKLGSLLLDISIGTLVLGAVIRLILALTYFKRNGNRTLTDSQRKSLRKVVVPISLIGLSLSIASVILLLI